MAFLSLRHVSYSSLLILFFLYCFIIIFQTHTSKLHDLSYYTFFFLVFCHLMTFSVISNKYHNFNTKPLKWTNQVPFVVWSKKVPLTSFDRRIKCNFSWIPEKLGSLNKSAVLEVDIRLPWKWPKKTPYESHCLVT